MSPILFAIAIMNDFVPELVRNVRDAAANPDRWTHVFGLLLSGASNGRRVLTFYREHGSGARIGVACTVDRAPGAAMRLAVSERSAKGKLAGEFRFDDEVYGIRADCPSCGACCACGALGQVREEIAASIKINRALLAGGLVTSCLRTVLDALPDPAFVLSPDGIMAWKNAAAGAKEWADAYAGAPGKPFALKDAAAQAAFRTALSEAGQEAGSAGEIRGRGSGEERHAHAGNSQGDCPLSPVQKPMGPSLSSRTSNCRGAAGQKQQTQPVARHAAEAL